MKSMILASLCRKETMKMTDFSTCQIQERIYQNKVNKGFNTTDIPKEFCLLYGEVGEAFDAWRKEKSDFGEELADIAIYLLGIAEITGIDLGAEIRRKIQVNEKRKYRDENGVKVKFDKETF